MFQPCGGSYVPPPPHTHTHTHTRAPTHARMHTRHMDPQSTLLLYALSPHRISSGFRRARKPGRWMLVGVQEARETAFTSHYWDVCWMCMLGRRTCFCGRTCGGFQLLTFRFTLIVCQLLQSHWTRSRKFTHGL